ncbi:MAG: hypothetical protein EOO44_10555 [Flavobacterium sp.]|nr:MAG: hypothetical protein EOO44_10555 [Flavobacterium sp.]
MKVSKSLLTLFFLILANISSVMAGPNPPAPMAKSSSAAAAAAGPPPPPGAPIDQNLIILLAGALILGTYTIYNYNLKRKASV